MILAFKNKKVTNCVKWRKYWSVPWCLSENAFSKRPMVAFLVLSLLSFAKPQERKKGFADNTSGPNLSTHFFHADVSNLCGAWYVVFFFVLLFIIIVASDLYILYWLRARGCARRWTCALLNQWLRGEVSSPLFPPYC